MAVEATEKYCPICGKPVTDSTYKRFGELCCSETHAEEYVKDVRAQKVQAQALQGRPVAPAGREEAPQEGWSGRRRGGCC
jgi:hypothetical protein